MKVWSELKEMEATTIAPISFPTAMNCSPWVDYVEEHKGESAVGVVMFVNCLLTILANIILFIVIFSNKESREQVWFAWTRNRYIFCDIFWNIFQNIFFTIRDATCSWSRSGSAMSCTRWTSSSSPNPASVRAGHHNIIMTIKYFQPTPASMGAGHRNVHHRQHHHQQQYHNYHQQHCQSFPWCPNAMSAVAVFLTFGYKAIQSQSIIFYFTLYFLNKLYSRFIDSINKSVYACQGIHILGTFLIAATWYNFLGGFHVNLWQQ